MGTETTKQSNLEMSIINYRYCQLNAEAHKQPLDYGTGELYSSAEVHSVLRIAEAPGITVTEISHLGGRTKSAVSQIVTRLENRGLVIRKKGPNRGVGLFVTDKGQALCDAYSAYIEQKMPPLMERYIERFGQEAMDAFYSIMESMIKEQIDAINQEN